MNISLVRPIFTYSAACFCNAYVYLFKTFLRFERRLFPVLDFDPEENPSVVDFIDMSCEKHFSKKRISDLNHAALYVSASTIFKVVRF